MKENICQFTGKAYDCKKRDGYKEDWLNKGNHITHCCMSVSGPVFANEMSTWRRIARGVTDNNGNKLTPTQVKKHFFELYEAGNNCIPIGECNRFCYKNGCQGHKSGDK